MLLSALMHLSAQLPRDEALLLSHLQHRRHHCREQLSSQQAGLGLISDLLQAQSPPPVLLLSQQLRLLIRAEPQHFTLHHLTAFPSISIALQRRQHTTRRGGGSMSINSNGSFTASLPLFKTPARLLLALIIIMYLFANCTAQILTYEGDKV